MLRSRRGPRFPSSLQHASQPFRTAGAGPLSDGGQEPQQRALSLILGSNATPDGQLHANAILEHMACQAVCAVCADTVYVG